MYTDFFDAPRTIQKPVGKAKKAKVMDVKKGKKGKGKGVSFEEEGEEEAPEDDAREVMGRFKEDLFADDDEEEAADDQRKSLPLVNRSVLMRSNVDIRKETKGLSGSNCSIRTGSCWT